MLWEYQLAQYLSSWCGLFKDSSHHAQDELGAHNYFQNDSSHRAQDEFGAHNRDYFQKKKLDAETSIFFRPCFSVAFRKVAHPWLPRLPSPWPQAPQGPMGLTHVAPPD
jgi:hypothetical protein